jgi:hypothetical protein
MVSSSLMFNQRKPLTGVRTSWEVRQHRSKTLTGVSEEVDVTTEIDEPGNAAERAADDWAVLLPHDWRPSLQNLMGGWTWRVDPDDRLPPTHVRRVPAPVDVRVIRAYAWARILLG